MNKKIAAIDIGTNSFHLVIVEVSPEGKFKILDKKREIVRLGFSNNEISSFISKEDIKKAVEILKEYKERAQSFSANIRAIATSAVRESINKDDFVEAIKNKVGIDVEVVDGRTEAKLIFYGMALSKNFKNKKVLCLDIGGGSSEFIYAENNFPIITESVKVGAVTLSKKFFPKYILSKEAISACHSYVNAQLAYVCSLIENKKFQQVIGSSGTIVAAAILIQEKFNKPKVKSINHLKFSIEEFNSIYDEVINTKYPSQRKKIKGMEDKRADIIPAGLIILKTIFDLLSIESISVSEYALREGIVFDTINNYVKLKNHNSIV